MQIIKIVDIGPFRRSFFLGIKEMFCEHLF